MRPVKPSGVRSVNSIPSSLHTWLTAKHRIRFRGVHWEKDRSHHLDSRRQQTSARRNRNRHWFRRKTGYWCPVHERTGRSVRSFPFHLQLRWSKMASDCNEKKKCFIISLCNVKIEALLEIERQASEISGHLTFTFTLLQRGGHQIAFDVDSTKTHSWSNLFKDMTLLVKHFVFLSNLPVESHLAHVQVHSVACFREQRTPEVLRQEVHHQHFLATVHRNTDRPLKKGRKNISNFRSSSHEPPCFRPWNEKKKKVPKSCNHTSTIMPLTNFPAGRGKRWINKNKSRFYIGQQLRDYKKS